MTDINLIEEAADADREVVNDAVEFETGVETEQESNDEAPLILDPFDPTQIRMETKQQSLDVLIKRLANENEIVIPEFQRAEGIWSDTKKSLLIESILIRVPLPAFYMDATDEDSWLVIDGLQRLTTLRRFAVEKTLHLTGLEFLKDYEGKGWDDLPRSMQRRIEETQVTVYLVQRGTPPKVKFNIFKRINTGGAALSPQEIRNALNQGFATDLLSELATSEEFLRATDGSVKSLRMADREIVLRFLAFLIAPPEDYKTGDVDQFLNNTMATINKMGDAQLDELRRRFKRAMNWAWEIFGNKGFRKLSVSGRRGVVSKALFEAWGINLDRLEVEQLRLLRQRNEDLMKKFARLQEVNKDFSNAITFGTGHPTRIRIRFQSIRQLIEEVLQ